MGKVRRCAWRESLVLFSLVLVQCVIAVADPAHAQTDNSATTPSIPPHDETNVQPLGLTLARGSAGTGDGVTIVEVDPSSDAAKKGLKAGDVILNAANTPVSTPEQVAEVAKQTLELGRQAMMLHVRSGDQRRVVAVRIHTVETTHSGENNATGQAHEDTETRLDIAELLRNLPIDKAPQAGEKNLLGELEKLNQTLERLRGGLGKTGHGSNMAWLGVGIRDVADDDLRSFNLSSKNGAVITRVSPESPAASAGLQQNDVIVRLEAPPVRQDDVVVDLSGEINNAKDFSNRIATLAPSAQITLHLLRNGQPRDVAATLGAFPLPHNFQALAERAEKLFGERKYSEAEPLYREILSVSERLFGADDPRLGGVINKLGAAYYLQGRYQEAEPLAVRALTIAEKQKGPDNPDLVMEVGNLAAVYVHLERYDEAEQLYRRLIALREKMHGPDHPKVAQDLERLATMFIQKKQYADAEPLLMRAVTIREKAHGPDHPFVAIAVASLGAVYRDQGRGADAELLFRRALDIESRALGVDDGNTIERFLELAALRGESRAQMGLLYQQFKEYWKANKFVEAEPLVKQFIAIREKLLGPEHLLVAGWLDQLGRLYIAQEKFSDAEPPLKRAIAIYEKAYGPKNALIGKDLCKELSVLANAYYIQGRFAEAEPLYQRALAIAEKVEGRKDGDDTEIEQRTDGKVAYSEPAEPIRRDKSADVLYWQSVKESRSVEELESYLTKFPEGTFVDLARLRITRLGGKPAPTSFQEPQAAERSRRSSADEDGGATSAAQAVTIVADPAAGRKLEVRCGAVHDGNYKGAATQICAEGKTAEFSVHIADGTEAWCDGREKFAVYIDGRLLACRLKRPVIVVTEQGIERCSHDIELTDTGKLSKCDFDRN